MYYNRKDKRKKVYLYVLYCKFIIFFRPFLETYLNILFIFYLDQLDIRRYRFLVKLILIFVQEHILPKVGSMLALVSIIYCSFKLLYCSHIYLTIQRCLTSHAHHVMWDSRVALLYCRIVENTLHV